MKFTKLTVHFKIPVPQIVADALGIVCGILFVVIGMILLERPRDKDGLLR